MKTFVSATTLLATIALFTPLHAQSVAPVAPASRAAASPYIEVVRQGTVIAPDGHKAVTSIDRKWDPKAGVGTINEAAMTPDGQLSTREANLVRKSDGTIVARGAYTDFNGQTENFTETTKRTPRGEVITGRLFDEAGDVATYQTTMTRAPQHQTRVTTVFTYNDGRKTKRVEILAPAKTTVERS